MGQNKSVFITRFIVKDSVEEKMLKIQDRKVISFRSGVLTVEFCGEFVGDE